MATVIINCTNCSKPFTRRVAEHNRSLKMGRHEFCSRSCSITWANRNGLTNPGGNSSNLVPGNARDEYTPFRCFRLRCKKRDKEYSLTLEYLKNLWEEQEGKCPFTGWKLDLPASTTGFTKRYGPRNASLDRIDNSLGYIPGNVRYVALITNVAKGAWEDRVLIEFCEAVATYGNKRVDSI